MERTTFCLLFYIRRTKLNRNGEAPIMMRITVNGVRVDASVKKTIFPEFWSVDTN
jgi:putative transposase